MAVAIAGMSQPAGFGEAPAGPVEPGLEVNLCAKLFCWFLH
jgi:hypothetical protein